MKFPFVVFGLVVAAPLSILVMCKKVFVIWCCSMIDYDHGKDNSDDDDNDDDNEDGDDNRVILMMMTDANNKRINR